MGPILSIYFLPFTYFTPHFHAWMDISFFVSSRRILFFSTITFFCNKHLWDINWYSAVSCPEKNTMAIREEEVL